jgi:hypothetical protein
MQQGGAGVEGEAGRGSLGAGLKRWMRNGGVHYLEGGEEVEGGSLSIKALWLRHRPCFECGEVGAVRSMTVARQQWLE